MQILGFTIITEYMHLAQIHSEFAYQSCTCVSYVAIALQWCMF